MDRIMDTKVIENTFASSIDGVSLSSCELMEKYDGVLLSGERIDIIEKMQSLNEVIPTNISALDGVFGTKVYDKGNGWTEIRSNNEFGFKKIDHYFEGKLKESFEHIEKNITRKTWFDDNGNAYEHKFYRKTGLTSESHYCLVPNANVVKDNFYAKVDEMGRSVEVGIRDVQIGLERKGIKRELKDASYLDGDEIGHIMASDFGGPNSKINLVPQTFDVNRSQFARIENYVRNKRNEGFIVDYEMKINYKGKEMRPDSFEPSIVVNGIKQPFEGKLAGLEKIYNREISNVDIVVDKVKKTVGEISQKISPMNELGKKQGIEAATITCAVSTVSNLKDFFNGEIEADEMAINIAKDTVKAGGIGYASGFTTAAIAKAFEASSKELISSLSNSSVPAGLVSFGVTSYESVMNYAQGVTELSELAYNLGNNATSVTASTVGAKLGGVAGTMIAPGIGTAAGAMVGGMVGCAVASAAYKTALEYAPSGAKILANQVKACAMDSIEAAKEYAPDKVETIRESINSFTSNNGIPVQI